MSGERVVHCKREPYDVYIGRAAGKAGQWGNPYVIGPDGTRDEVIEKYAVWIRTQPELMKALPELRNKTLGCWCSPLRCHGSILISLLAELDDTNEKAAQED